MTDLFTLVIPTFNRAPSLAALLRYLERERAGFPILVADSSGAEHRDRNRKLVGQLALRIQYIERDVTTQPFQKFRDAVHAVTTPYCALCADDDLVLLGGLGQCIEHLEASPDTAVVHGYYFTFLETTPPPGPLDLTGILYYAPSIDADDPLQRVCDLFRNYQALTYGTYRTEVLQAAFDAVSPLTSMLGRELLSGAISVVRGKAVRLPTLTNGRSQRPSVPYRHWHPLEWLIESPEGLLEEYRAYRSILMDALRATPGWSRSDREAARVLDLVHMFYLVRHAPAEARDFILDRVLAGQEAGEFWRAREIQISLIRASRYIGDVTLSTEDDSPELPVERTPREIVTRVRTYRLHDAFLNAQPRELIKIDDDDVSRLIRAMNNYWTEGDSR